MSAGTKEQAILELRQFIDEIESDRYDLISIQSQTPYKIELYNSWLEVVSRLGYHIVISARRTGSTDRSVGNVL